MISVETKIALQEIIAQYSIASDAKDVQGHLQYYAKEGYIDGGMQSRRRDVGMAEDLAQMFAMEGTLKRHFGMNYRYSALEDGVAVDYLLLVVEGETLPGVIATATVRDEFIQEDGTWKIRKHTINIDPAMFNLLQQQDTGINADAFQQ